MPSPENMPYPLSAETQLVLDLLERLVPECANQIRKELRLAYLTGMQLGMRDVLDSWDAAQTADTK